MPASFPASVKTFTTKNTNDVIQPAHVNDVQDEVVSIETVISNSANMNATQITSYKFPAVAVPQSDSNTLDVYVESDWLPTIASVGGGTPTYTTQQGRYVKIGRLVKFWGRVVLATKGTLAAGVALIGGLPTRSETASVQLFGEFSVGSFGNLTTPYTSVQGYVNISTTTITLTGNGTASSNMASLQVSDLGATTDLLFGGSYLASS